MSSKKPTKPVKPEKSVQPGKKKKITPHNAHFLAILVLFAGFSIYAITSFYSSTDRYIDGMYASVTLDGEENLSDTEVPIACQTCPPQEICSGVCEEQQQPINEIFEDVGSDFDSAEAIAGLYFEGIINGYDDGTFRPENPINRAELWTILIDATDADISGQVLENCFTDVNTQWFAPFVCYAEKQGWVDGYEDGSYRPSNPVNKAEALKMVMKSFSFETPENVSAAPLPDVDPSVWFAPYVSAAIELEIIPGVGNFNAGEEMTRGNFAVMVYNAMMATAELEASLPATE